MDKLKFASILFGALLSLDSLRAMNPITNEYVSNITMSAKTDWHSTVLQKTFSITPMSLVQFNHVNWERNAITLGQSLTTYDNSNNIDMLGLIFLGTKDEISSICGSDSNPRNARTMQRLNMSKTGNNEFTAFFVGPYWDQGESTGYISIVELDTFLLGFNGDAYLRNFSENIASQFSHEQLLAFMSSVINKPYEDVFSIPEFIRATQEKNISNLLDKVSSSEMVALFGKNVLSKLQPADENQRANLNALNNFIASNAVPVRFCSSAKDGDLFRYIADKEFVLTRAMVQDVDCNCGWMFDFFSRIKNFFKPNENQQSLNEQI